jgi:trafficking protein particle complex subunit 6
MRLGRKLGVKLTQQAAPFTDGKDAIKFICKDLWLYLFRQQASRLQANHKGVFIVHDTSFPPLYVLAKCTLPIGTHPPDPLPPIISKRALLQLQMTCGVIQGFMEALGFPCTVDCALGECIPACSFTISLSADTLFVTPPDASI